MEKEEDKEEKKEEEEEVAWVEPDAGQLCSKSTTKHTTETISGKKTGIFLFLILFFIKISAGWHTVTLCTFQTVGTFSAKQMLIKKKKTDLK